ncbi:glycosyltransferase [Synechococcus sp. Tobar12-5m-g]|uniref:glycosyltransferase n=1 Tax=unclassified Synechococcus TaxID=2626047 RepID=UPI0020CBBE80|nr:MULTISPECIES: glycosyltransferase [unclassified Synechococcus]MCP9773911.1 glycosyltransferase [Synechococcus sp. Tobar12-5m-g]MCP9874879.1 glycosyltransferase [Synechococcus sp. Cruz CV-v-12]
MRLLHLSNDLYPRVTGGTEIFVHQLSEAQQQLKPTPAILWAAHEAPLSSPDHAYQARLLKEQRLLPPIQPGNRRQQVASTAAEIPGFSELLQEFRPDVVHLHSWSGRCGLNHARAVKAFGARLVITVHAPGFSCIKGNLIDASETICDGVLRQRRCTRCRLHNGGVPRLIAAAVALQSGWPLDAESAGSLAHVLTARQLTAAFHQAWLELTELADAIHVLAAWSRDVLLRQGITEQKIHLIRTAGPPLLPPRQRRPMQDGVLRLVYWGRCHPVKGLHLVIEAIRRLPAEAPIQLDFYGPYWDSAYGQQLLERISVDHRFRLMGNRPKDQLLPLLQGYDLAVVPSTWLETGPLTVLEAFAAGLPVAGSNLGGIKELLDGAAGHLLPQEAKAWQHFLQRSLNNPEALKQPPLLVRAFSAVATELLPVYA